MSKENPDNYLLDKVNEIEGQMPYELMEKSVEGIRQIAHLTHLQVEKEAQCYGGSR